MCAFTTLFSIFLLQGLCNLKKKLLNLRENATEQQRSEDLDTEATEILKLIGF